MHLEKSILLKELRNLSFLNLITFKPGPRQRIDASCLISESLVLLRQQANATVHFFLFIPFCSLPLLSFFLHHPFLPCFSCYFLLFFFISEEARTVQGRLRSLELWIQERSLAIHFMKAL